MTDQEEEPEGQSVSPAEPQPAWTPQSRSPSPWAAPDQPPPGYAAPPTYTPQPVSTPAYPAHPGPPGPPGYQPSPGYQLSPGYPVSQSVPPGYPPTSGVPLGYPGQPSGPRPQVPIPPETRLTPGRVEPVPGTSFGVAYLDVPAATSGTAVSSLVTGIASIVVSFVVTCFGLAGANAGWGGWVAGAFAVMAVLLGLAAIGLGLAGLRQVRRARQRGTIRVGGRGLAITGLACGGSGLAITVLALVATLLIQFS